MKYYYLINGTVKVALYKIPETKNWNTYSLWLSSLQPCEISSIEMDEIEMYLSKDMSTYFDCTTPIDITNIVFEKNGKIYFKKPQQFGNTEQVNLNIEKIYKCECGWKGSWKQMKREQDFGYDQSCCPKCNNVMFNNLHGEIHCEQVDNESDAEALNDLIAFITFQNPSKEDILKQFTIKRK